MATKFRFKNADGTTVDFEDYYVRADYFRSGNLWTWGDNTHGQLGDNTVTKRSSPVQTIAWGSNWINLSYQSDLRTIIAIKSDGTLWGSGLNNGGQLGDNTVTKRSSPVQTAAFGSNWKQSSHGTVHTAGIKTDGTLYCWGDNTTYGQLGDNTVVPKSIPTQTIAFGTNWKQVSCGGRVTAAIKTDGTLWCWGWNSSGQLGDNTATNRSSPVQTVAFGTNWKQVYAGQQHTAAIKTDGTLWCWGLNNVGQLGDNTTTNRSSPVQTISFGTNWKQVSCGYGTAAIKTDGTLWCWGYGTEGQLGDNNSVSRSSPVQTITYGSNWKQVSCGLTMGAVKTDGTLWLWGWNSNGTIGDNTTTNRSSPVQTVAFGSNWKQVSCGDYLGTSAIQYQDDYQ